MADSADDNSVDDDDNIQADEDGSDNEPAYDDQDQQEKDEDEELHEDQDKEPEEEDYPEVILDAHIIAECLSLLCKTGDGLAHAFVRMDLKDRELTDISMLQSYIHVRYVDISQNNLKDISCISSLTHLLTLNAEKNLLTTAELPEMPYLQYANFSSNRIKTTIGLNHPLLEHLVLSYNDISMVSDLDTTILTRLHTLELRGNKLTTTRGINILSLKNLFLAANMLHSLDGLDRLSALTTLHIRDNQIETLDGFNENLQSLQYINLRGNNIQQISEISKLKSLKLLRALVLSENPVCEEEDYRMETLIELRKLERLDKDEYSEEDRMEAEEIHMQRQSEERLATEQKTDEDDTNQVL